MKSCSQVRWITGLVAAWGAAWPTAAVEPRGDVFVEFRNDTAPLLEKHCTRCHGGAKPRAELALDRYRNAHDVLNDYKVWHRILEHLEAKSMPPEDTPQPSADDRRRLIAAVQQIVDRAQCGPTVDPGRVTTRRLNRNEYDNTIRDLVGIDFHPAADFPADDVGYGFDNIGDVLTLPPLLLEKYLSAAEQAAAQAIVLPPTEPSQVIKYKANAVRRRGHEAEPYDDKARFRMLAQPGELHLVHRFESSARYQLNVRAYGEAIGSGPVRMSLRLDGKEIARREVKGTAEKPIEFTFDIDLASGVHEIAFAYVDDDRAADKAEQAEPAKESKAAGFAFERMLVTGPLAKPWAEQPEPHRRILFTRPEKETSRRAAAEKIVARFASQAWRRPTTGDEVERLIRLFDGCEARGTSFEQGIQALVAAVLASPHFLFRIEQDRPPVDESGAYPLDEFELASRLSYFLWSSSPDDELLRLAGSGRLRAELPTQVRRLIADPKADAFVRNFSGQWLQTRNLTVVAPNRKAFPHYTPQLRDDMRRETELFFAAVLRDDRSLLEFLNADYTFVNGRLAEHYGLPHVAGDEFRRVSLADGRRGGVLGQASVLTVTSDPTRTSPVKRGKFILENILGTPPPPPPPGAGDLKDDAQAQSSGSLRERMERHRRDPICASCHSRMDPLGFGLENFDAIGRWRDRDGAFAIDASGTLPSGRTFKGPAELKQTLWANRGEFVNCLIEKMLTYALGRGLEYYDHCAIEVIATELERNDYRFSALIEGIVTSRPFQMRRAARSEP